MDRRRTMIFAVLLAAAVSNAQYDSYNCPTMWSSGTYATACTNISPCSHTCPPNVKIGIEKKSTDLPCDGWFAFTRNDSGVYTSALKSFVPVLLPATAGDKISDKLHISDDGKWILYLTDKKTVVIIGKDGSNRTPLAGIEATAACWFRSSPKGTEVACLTGGKDVVAVRIDFSSGKPVAGASRTVGRDLGGLSGGEFAVAKDIIFARVNNTMFGKNVNSGTLFTIPDGGLGTADASSYYKSRWQYNCGMTLSHSGARAASNANSQNAAQYTDCIMGGHWGVSVVPVKRVTDSLLSLPNWFLKQGAIDWAPEAWRSTSSLNLHHHNFTNAEEWLVSVDWNQSSSTTPTRHGIQLLHWPSNTWYLIGKDGLGPSAQYIHPAVFLTSYPAPTAVASVSGNGVSRTGRPAGSVKLSAWTDIMGRQVGRGGTTTTSSWRIETDGHARAGWIAVVK